MALALMLAAWPALDPGRAPAVVLALGGLGAALAVAGVARPWPRALPWALGLLGAEYVASLALRGVPVDPASPAYAAAYLLGAELGWLAVEARRGGEGWPERLVGIGLLAMAATVVGALLLLVATLPVGGSAVLTAGGVAAAVAVAACLAWLARR